MTLRKREQRQVGQLTFVGEQDGIPEREFKSRVHDCLTRRQMLCRAYLVKVRYADEHNAVVALCLADLTQADDIQLAIGTIFSEIFTPESFLDVISISVEQEEWICRVAKPFYGGTLAPK